MRRQKKFTKLDLSRCVENLEEDAVFGTTGEHTPTESQVGSFVSAIRQEVDGGKQRMPVFVDDLGPEGNLNGINPLPADSPILMMALSKEGETKVINEHLSKGITSSPSLILDESLDRGSTAEIPRYTKSLSVDDLALLLVDLTEGQTSGEQVELLPSHASSSRMCTPNESTEGNVTDEQRVESAAPMPEHIGMGTCNDWVFRDGFQVVVNLSSRELTQAEISVLSKGLSFCPTPRGIDIFALRKDMFDYVRRLRLKEYYCGDEEVDGDFSETPGFRKRSTWCPERNRDVVLETYVTMLESKIFSQDLRVRCQRNLSKEEQKALDNLRGYTPYSQMADAREKTGTRHQNEAF